MSIIVASILGAWISFKNADEKMIRTLLSSPSTIDQLAGIEKIKGEPFDATVERLTPLLSGDKIVAYRASEVIVQRAFADSCVEELRFIQINPALCDAALWWNSIKTNVPLNPTHHAIACERSAAPWLRRLASLRCDSLDVECLSELATMPLRDRDGSVLLATLAIHKHGLNTLTDLWSKSIDIDQRKIAMLLQGLASKHIAQTDADPVVQTLITIMNEQNGPLAWRTMHKRGGIVDPDVFLAGLIVDRDRFLLALLETAQSGRWNHPEHAVELARAFAPRVVSYLPESLQNEPKSRKQWWDRFACGLLLEKR